MAAFGVTEKVTHANYDGGQHRTMVSVAAVAHGRGVAGMSSTTEADSASRHGHASNVVKVPLSDVAASQGAADGFTIFAAMPFDPTFDDVFFVGVTSAARTIGGQAIRVDQTMHGRDAVIETQQLIRRCRVVVADLSTGEPDVLYELGFAHALGKPSVQICCTPHDDLPFMVRNRETLLYRPGRTHLLGQQLAIYLTRLLRLG